MERPPAYEPRGALSSDDLETASIHSTAPSYRSEAPPYAPSTRPGLPSPYTSSPAHPSSRTYSEPSLNAFRMSSWSQTTANPSARHYHNVASRRASARTVEEQATLLAAALNGENGIAQMKRKMDEETREREIRTLEDPHLVGEEAAAKNTQERVRRENGWNVLETEDKRWDWLLAQMSDWEERDKSWRKFRKELEEGKRHKLAKRLGLGRP